MEIDCSQHHLLSFQVGETPKVRRMVSCCGQTNRCPNAALQDFGKGWLNLTENSNGAIASFWDFDWGANIHRTERRAFPDETILATVYERADHMKGLTPGWDKDMHFVHSTDFFKSAHTRLVACGNQFEVIGHKV